jgi:hypothetical protein
MDGNGILSRITANASSNFPSLMRRIYRGTSIPAGHAHWQGGAVVSAFETYKELMVRERIIPGKHPMFQ